MRYPDEFLGVDPAETGEQRRGSEYFLSEMALHLLASANSTPRGFTLIRENDSTTRCIVD